MRARAPIPHSRTAVALISCGLASCGPQTQQVPRPVAVATPVAPRSGAAQRDVSPNCTISEPALASRVSLRLRPGGDPVAEVGGKPSATLALPAQRGPEPPKLTLEKDGVLLFTPHDEEEAPLRLSRVLALRGMVVPHAFRPIEWQSVSGTQVTVRYYLGESFEPTSLGDVVACEDLGFNEVPYEAMDLFGRPCEPGEDNLVRGQNVTLRSSLEVTSEQLTVRIAESAISYVDVWRRQDEWAHVCFPTDDEVVVGWVNQDALRSEPLDLIGRGYGVGGLGLRGTSRSEPVWTRCSEELPLRAQRGEESGEVGRIRPGTRFEVEEKRGDFSVVDLWADWIDLQQDAQFLVPTSALAGCKAD